MVNRENNTSIKVVGQSVNATANFEIFHEATKYTPARAAKTGPRIIQYLTHPRYVMETRRNYKVYDLNKFTNLVPEQSCYLDVKHVMHERCSSREFSLKEIEIEAISNILGWSAKAVRFETADMPQRDRLSFRPYPSGGGLYPVELYMLAINCKGLANSLYHYNPVKHCLETVDKNPPINLYSQALMNPGNILENCAAVFIMTSIFQRTTTKYGDRGYRIALLEAGHLAQNLALSAESMGLGSLAWGGYFDDHLSILMNVDPVDEPVIHVIFVGQK